MLLIVCENNRRPNLYRESGPGQFFTSTRSRQPSICFIDATVSYFFLVMYIFIDFRIVRQLFVGKVGRIVKNNRQMPMPIRPVPEHPNRLVGQYI